MKRHLLMAAAMMALTSAGQASPCNADRATYALDGDAAHRLSFGPAREPNAWSALALTLAATSGDRHYGFTASNGYSFNYLVDQADTSAAGESPQVFFFDRNLKPLEIPQRGDAPPAYIFAPELGSLLWYGPHGGGEEFMPVGFWRFAGCR